ncbi:VPLPA-CTERM sorting domain-containing protein [Ovoidimarina sediminis]|uniref:VPLPA-CTERM sorting domain-containing protein n=1 Tax=Ovoidimarina sediminis TaxID=3079856 RepID=UPI00290EACB5|nr:VPLPA-CTERM sorting domain-containing protein [Rhodophyticola sp. MJ-SS7]MDU8942232.1 VPLPA-CTERM sorting domain-containing protein [Rhodophyticola sp. MJ-SS7]
MNKFVSFIVAAGVATMMSSGAFAATVETCADTEGGPMEPSDGGERSMTISVDSGFVECVAWGTGQFGEGSDNDIEELSAYLDSINFELLGLIDKSDDPTSGSDPDALVGPLTSGTDGEFSISTDPEYPFYVLIFKFGAAVGQGAEADPDWFAFLIDAEAASDPDIVWYTSEGFQQGLSHVDLYAAVPIPAAGFLLLGGLGGLALLRRKRMV